MFSLSPAKILVVLIVALVVLGPEKLPGMARQVGAFWGDLRRLRSRLENEVRGVFPDLPPTHELSQAVRSPLTLLNRLADEHERTNGNDAVSSAPPDASATRAPPGTGNGSTNGSEVANPGWMAGEAGADESDGAVLDDPSMN